MWAQSAITLQTPEYAARGPFTINLWAKTANNSQTGPQYLLSHQRRVPLGTDPVNDPWGPNQAIFWSWGRLLESIASVSFTLSTNSPWA